MTESLVSIEHVVNMSIREYHLAHIILPIQYR